MRASSGCAIEQAAMPRLVQDGARQHVFRTILRSGGQRQNVGLAAPYPDHLDDAEASLGNRARLIEKHGVDFGRILQHRAAAHQDAAPRQPADRRHHGRGCRQNQRARAGHNQHRHRAQPIPREIKRQPRHQQQRRQEITRKAVRQPFHRRPLFARMFHQLDHSRQRGLRACARDREAQQAQAVQSARENLVAGGLCPAAAARP